MSAALYVERGPRGKWRSLPEPDYLRLLTAQGGGCAICGTTPKTRRLHVDHDHKTGRVRGLLCHRCNRALPAWVSPDWLIRAAEYLSGGPLAARVEAGKLRAPLAEMLSLLDDAVVLWSDAEWARIVAARAALAGSDAPPTPRPTCGSERPHGRHEYLVGARRHDCPGSAAAVPAERET